MLNETDALIAMSTLELLVLDLFLTFAADSNVAKRYGMSAFSFPSNRI